MKKKTIRSNVVWMAILATTEIAVFVLINYVDGIWKRLCGVNA